MNINKMQGSKTKTSTEKYSFVVQNMIDKIKKSKITSPYTTKNAVNRRNAAARIHEL